MLKPNKDVQDKLNKLVSATARLEDMSLPDNERLCRKLLMQEEMGNAMDILSIFYALGTTLGLDIKDVSCAAILVDVMKAKLASIELILDEFVKAKAQGKCLVEDIEDEQKKEEEIAELSNWFGSSDGSSKVN